MADSQVPWRVDALGGTITEAAWRVKPSWYLVVTDDKMVPRPPSAPWSSAPAPPSPRSPGSHSIYVSQPQAVATLIKQAAAAT